MMSVRTFMAGLLALLVAGCSQAPLAPPPAYLLPSASSVGHSPLEVQIRLASYLNQGGIVIQLSNSEMQGARQHRWAEPLALQLRRSLLAGLNGVDVPDTGVLVVQLSQFQGVQRVGGDLAAIQGIWEFNDRDREAAMLQGQINWQSPLPGDGYAALVETLDLGWTEVVSQIAQTLRGNSGPGE